jgi:hypothetical protein
LYIFFIPKAEFEGFMYAWWPIALASRSLLNYVVYWKPLHIFYLHYGSWNKNNITHCISWSNAQLGWPDVFVKKSPKM